LAAESRLAVAIAIIEFLWDGWRPHFAILGRVPGLRGYHDLERYPHGEQIRSRAIPLGCTALLCQRQAVSGASVTGHRGIADTRAQSGRGGTAGDKRRVTSADMLRELIRKLKACGIELHFAELKDPVRDKLRRFEMSALLGDAQFHPTIGSAVDDHLGNRAVEEHRGDAGPAPSGET
jgi:STAS domain